MNLLAMSGEPPAYWLLLAFPFLAWGSSHLLSHVGGWHQLAKRFATRQPPAGQRLLMQSAKVGMFYYSGCLTIHVSPEGVRLALMFFPFPGHPPLLIPWKEMHQIRTRDVWSEDWVRLEIGSPRVSAIDLTKKVFAHQPAAA